MEYRIQIYVDGQPRQMAYTPRGLVSVQGEGTIFTSADIKEAMIAAYILGDERSIVVLIPPQ